MSKRLIEVMNLFPSNTPQEMAMMMQAYKDAHDRMARAQRVSNQVHRILIDAHLAAVCGTVDNFENR